METIKPRGTKDDELSPSKHQQHEQAAQVLNRSCPPPSTTKGIDDNLNGATSLNSHSHVSDSNQVKIPAINEEKNKEMAASNDESQKVEIVYNRIEECNR